MFHIIYQLIISYHELLKLGFICQSKWRKYILWYIIFSFIFVVKLILKFSKLQ